jgi:hypothetical protein
MLKTSCTNMHFCQHEITVAYIKTILESPSIAPQLFGMKSMFTRNSWLGMTPSTSSSG